MEAKKAEAARPNEEYVDASFILGSSCIVETFFSMCKNILTEKRAGLSPYMFQCLAFLKVNKEMWGLADVAEVIKMAKDKKKNEREEEDYEKNKEAVDNNKET